MKRSASIAATTQAIVCVASVPALAVMDMHFDTATWGVDGFGQSQLDHLVWTSPNTHAIAMPDDGHRSAIDTSGNVYAGYYDSLTALYGTGASAASCASTLNTYFQNNATHGTKPTWVELNEISASNWPNNDNYRIWLRETVSLLKNTYGYNIILFSPFANPQSNGQDWAPLSQDCYITVENFLSGQEVKDQSYSLQWVQSQYLASINSYSARGVDPSRLFLTEYFTQTVAGTNWGRAGVTAAEWNQTIALRNDAIRNVGFAGFVGYGWSHNSMGAPLADSLSFIDTYRSHIVVESEGAKWNLDGNASWNTSANWTKASVSILPIPPTGESEIANFVKQLSAPRTITVDGPKTLGRMTLSSTNAYTIAPGASGSITFANNTLNTSITVPVGSHIITAPITANDNLDLKLTGGNLTLAGAITTAASKSITKTGPGVLTINGPQSYGTGSALKINAGSAILNSDAGTASDRKLTLSATASSVTLNSSQHLVALNLLSSSTATLAASGSRAIVTSAITIVANASLNITDNGLIVDYPATSYLSIVRGYVRAGRGGTGFANATWQGAGGIRSAAAAASDRISFALGYVDNSTLPTLGLPSYTVFEGQPVDGSSVLVRYTLGADANLDGRVNTDDVTIVGALYNHAGSNEWFLGDFDYDGMCDTDDVTVLGALYDATAPALSDAQLTSQYGSEFAQAFQIGRLLGASAVPEPTTTVGIVMFGGTLLGRRRRR